MTKLNRCLQIASLVLVASALTPGLYADLGVTFSDTSGAQNLGNPPFTLGWEFTVNSAITVNDLAMYDQDQVNGNTDSYSVGIWDSSGNLLVSGTVANGTTDPLVDQFREVGVTATNLAAGNYFIGALYLDGNDPVFFPSISSLSNFASGNGVTYDSATYVGGPTLSDPTNSFGTPGYFGPNFDYSSASGAVPEPSAALLLGILVAILFGLRKASSAGRLLRDPGTGRN